MRVKKKFYPTFFLLNWSFGANFRMPLEFITMKKKLNKKCAKARKLTMPLVFAVKFCFHFIDMKENLSTLTGQKIMLTHIILVDK